MTRPLNGGLPPGIADKWYFARVTRGATEREGTVTGLVYRNGRIYASVAWDRSQGHPAFDAARDVVPLSSLRWVENLNTEGSEG